MTTAEIKTITCDQLAQRVKTARSVDVIDVRTPAEFREVHCVHATNVPLDSLDPQAIMAARGGSPDEPLYVICRSGTRAAKACEAFLKAGYTNVVNVEGGTQAWDHAGLPVRRGRKTMSLERQVRIAAGFLVVLGVVLKFAVHDYFVLLSLFVGAGLMFAGITDTCAMGMLIAKMPWNQVKPGPSADQATDQQNTTPTGSCCG